MSDAALSWIYVSVRTVGVGVSKASRTSCGGLSIRSQWKRVTRRFKLKVIDVDRREEGEGGYDQKGWN